MLNKFLNKKVIIREKVYSGISTIIGRGTLKGVVTAVNEDFIELDNNIIVAIKFIYLIELAE